MLFYHKFHLGDNLALFILILAYLSVNVLTTFFQTNLIILDDFIVSGFKATY
jgi:hypothetical protein